MDMAASQGAAPQPADQAARLSRLKDLLRADPDNPRLAADCVDLAIASRDYGFARDVLARFAAVTPNDTAVRINLALCHYCLAEYVEASTHLVSAYQSGDRSAGLLRLLVSTYHHLGRIEEAVAIANENPRRDADPALAGVYALAYLDAGQTARAATYARRSLEVNPNCVDALIAQATVNASRMHVAHAREEYERVLQLAPRNARALIGLGMLDLFAKNLPAAREKLTQGLEYMPTHAGSWIALGWTHLLSGDLPAAQRVFNHALELNHNFGETHGGLAAVAALQGDAASAERAMEVAERLQPQGLGAKFARSVLLTRRGQGPEGRRLLSETLRGLSQGEGTLLDLIIEEAAKHAAPN
jgi:Tfp pilus assembly protein PilF